MSEIVTYVCVQYWLSGEKDRIDELIDSAVHSAEAEGCRVITLGMLNKVFFQFSCNSVFQLECEEGAQ